MNLLAKRGLGRYKTVRQTYEFLKPYLKSNYVEIDGNKMFLDSGDGLSLSIRGVWEKFETECVKKIIKKGYLVIDVGANIGYYSLIFSKLTGNDGKVFAFEPEPSNFDLLKKNVEINKCQNVVLEQKAISDKKGRIKLYLHEKNSGGHRLYSFDYIQRFVEVDVTSLDDYFDQYDSKIDFIKIDVEGLEVTVMQGMKSLLKNSKDIILVMEFAPSLIKKGGWDPEEYFKILLEQGFRLYEINEKTEKIEHTDKELLLKKYPMTKDSLTNLLCIKGNFPQEIEYLIDKP